MLTGFICVHVRRVFHQIQRTKKALLNTNISCDNMMKNKMSSGIWFATQFLKHDKYLSTLLLINCQEYGLPTTLHGLMDGSRQPILFFFHLHSCISFSSCPTPAFGLSLVFLPLGSCCCFFSLPQYSFLLLSSLLFSSTSSPKLCPFLTVLLQVSAL